MAFTDSACSSNPSVRISCLAPTPQISVLSGNASLLRINSLWGVLLALLLLAKAISVLCELNKSSLFEEGSLLIGFEGGTTSKYTLQFANIGGFLPFSGSLAILVNADICV